MDSKFLKEVRDLIDEHGIQCLRKEWLENHGKKHILNRVNNSLRLLATELQLQEEWVESQSNFIVSDIKNLVDQHGICVVAKKWLVDNGHRSIYWRMREYGMSLDKIAERLQMTDAFLADPNRKPPAFTQQTFDRLVQEVIDKYGCLPAARFLIKNGHSVICHRIAEFGPSFLGC